MPPTNELGETLPSTILPPTSLSRTVGSGVASRMVLSASAVPNERPPEISNLPGIIDDMQLRTRNVVTEGYQPQTLPQERCLIYATACESESPEHDHHLRRRLPSRNCDLADTLSSCRTPDPNQLPKG